MRSRRIVFTSDQHFGHANIIKYQHRPYKNVDEMDSALIESWNAKVDHDDIVFHLGDFTLGDERQAARYFSRLNGAIGVVRGSHDDRWYKNSVYYRSRSGIPVKLLGDRFDYSSAMIGEDGRNLLIVMSHYAMARWPISHYGSLHVFGHSHGNFEGIGKSVDVGVDVYPNLLYIEEVVEILAKKSSPENHLRKS